MNILYFLKKHSLIIYAAIFSLLFNSCGLFDNFTTTYDPVKKTKRIEMRTTLNGPSNTVLNSIEQTLIKEIYEDKSVHYQIFELLKFEDERFQLEETVFLVINGDDVVQVPMEDVTTEQVKIREELKSSKEESDSSNVRTGTRYTVHTENHTRYHYSVAATDMEKIKTCKSLIFQYYAGPQMIQVKIPEYKLKEMKKWLGME